MTPHPARATLHAFGQRALSPAEFLATDRHLATCVDCAELGQETPRPGVSRILYDSDMASSSDGHLDYDVLERLVDGTAGAADRAMGDRHVAECADCRAAFEDLRAFERELAATRTSTSKARRSRAPASWRGVLSLVGTAAAVAMAVVVTRLVREEQATPVVTDAGRSVAVPLPGSSSLPPPPAVVPSPPDTVAARPSATPPATEVLRSGTRRVGDKTFRFVAGVWTDEAYDRLALLPHRTIADDERAEVLGAIQALAPFAALGPKVIVVLDGTVYRFGSP